jgi:uncharacterized cysteine cluster protein YcgN (CxxCxxCC family)
VAVVSWGSTPHISAVTTKENISYLKKKKKKIPSAMQMMAAIIRTCSWMGVGCPVSATGDNNSSYPEKHLVSKEKQDTKQKKMYQQCKQWLLSFMPAGGCV